MSRPYLMCLWIPAAALGVTRVAAADEPVSPASPKPEPSVVISPTVANSATADTNVAVPATPAPPPRRLRPMSPTVASQISSLAPKFEPAKSEKAIEPGTDLREIDKPRNTIIRLPNFEVKEDKAPAIKPHELGTPKERLELALKKYPGLRVGSFWIFRNDGVALAMQAEDERLERMKDMDDLLTLLPASQAKQVRPAVDDAFARRDFGR